ncbi:site-2 protease family protein [Novosphingobium sp.]|uniref:site-2 protease family protein n=1 Tax=Novosphingobium sp. TaxID=1874826 RepID=UPI001EC26340|nr:site-2 protease family protein [Novosphingobium sp.]MBK6802560.1 site-2 protease family protein [Novosphingobium sp.]MBK9009294.1 site-2 protease family protein [Novosphingobium sp.]
MNDTIYQAAALIVPLVIAIVFHEVAHGWTARALGDPTAAELGRLSLNPIRHVDPFGTVILPGMLMLAGWPVFGWAKPVPVVKARLRNPRRDMMIVAAAGPGSNLVMAAIAAVALGLLLPGQGEGQGGPLQTFLFANLLMFISINVFLALFNLLPIPPFDGGHIVEGLLPPAVARRYAGLHSKALLIMILLLVVVPLAFPSLNVVRWLVGPPVEWLTGRYMELAAAIAGA